MLYNTTIILIAIAPRPWTTLCTAALQTGKSYQGGESREKRGMIHVVASNVTHFTPVS